MTNVSELCPTCSKGYLRPAKVTDNNASWQVTVTTEADGFHPTDDTESGKERLIKSPKALTILM